MDTLPINTWQQRVVKSYLTEKADKRPQMYLLSIETLIVALKISKVNNDLCYHSWPIVYADLSLTKSDFSKAISQVEKAAEARFVQLR